ncbi:hypothetical protein X975_14883, partial [Stegodyphus mimosarum]
MAPDIFSNCVRVDEDLEVCGKLSDDSMIKTVREEEKEERFLDSEEVADTIKCPNDQAILKSTKT